MDSAESNGVRLDFHTDVAEFLALAADCLAAEPVLNTVVTTAAERALARQADGIAPPDGDWWLTVHDGSGAVVGAGMRTATSRPRPPFLLPMPDAAALLLARTVHDRGERLLAVNGALPAARVCADELARLGTGRVEVSQHTRLHVLGELTPPAPVPGRLIGATDEDVDLVMRWLEAFADDADEQAGRPRGSSTPTISDRGLTLQRIRDGDFWFWVTGTGRRVHMTGAHPPSYGVARIAPVYTPPAERGRGWASNAVAAVSERIHAEGARACLYTDQANPTSNKIYADLGYRPVADMANLAIVR